MQTWQIHCGDALAVLKTLLDESVNCVVTSPPYFGLRDYGTGRWEGGSEDCAHTPRAQLRGTFEVGQPASLRDKPSRECRCGAVRIDNQIGLESSPQAYVLALLEVFREVKRVLRDDGVCWLNLGDSYAGSWGNQGRKEERGSQRPINGGMLTDVHDGRYPAKESNTGAVPDGLKPKDLMGIPWRVALALQADGWWLRSDVIWHKKSCMPESVTDRPTRSHEYVFLLTKSARYWYDADAIREPLSDSSVEQIEYFKRNGEQTEVLGSLDQSRNDVGGRLDRVGRGARGAAMLMRKKKEVYTGQATKDYDSEGAQDQSGTKRRVLETIQAEAEDYLGANARTVWSIGPDPSTLEHFAVMPRLLARRCILAGCPFGGTVLDPFAGSGTTGVVALEEGRHFVGIELNPKYHAMARERLANVAPLLATEVST